MTQAIGYIFHGIDLRDPAFEHLTDDLSYIYRNRMAERHESGRGDGPLYIGLLIGEVREGRTYELGSISTVATEHEINVARLNLNESIEWIENDPEISNEFKDVLTAQVPKTYLVWGSN